MDEAAAVHGAGSREGQAVADTDKPGYTDDRLSLDARRGTSGQPYGFSMSVSRDGGPWSGALARVAGRSFTQDAVFPVRTARYARITLTASGSVPWVVTDLRLYGEGPTPPPHSRPSRPRPGTGAAGYGGDRRGGLRRLDRLPADQRERRPPHRTPRLHPHHRCTLQLRLDTPHGPLAATLPIRVTGSTGTRQEQSVTLPTA